MTNLKIINPCKENWNSMAPNKLGRFCQLCDKTVIDFTKMSPDEIKVVSPKMDGKEFVGASQVSLLKQCHQKKNNGSIPYE